MEKNAERADVGVTKAIRLYLDDGEIAHAFGLDKDDNPDYAYPNGEIRGVYKKGYDRSADISYLGLYQDQGHLMQNDQTLTPYINRSGEVATREGITVNDAIREACSLALSAKVAARAKKKA